MSEEKTEEQTTATRRLPRVHRRAWFWVATGLVALVVLLLSVAPIGIKYALEQWFLSHGAEVVGVEDVDLNLFTRRAALRNLQVKVADRNVLTIPQAVVRFSGSPLFRKRAHVRELALDGLDVEIVQLADGGWRFGGILAALLQGAEREAPADTPTSLWGMGLDVFELGNARVVLRTPAAASTLLVQRMRVTRVFTWLPGERAQLEFSGQVNAAPVQLSMDSALFAEERTAKVKVKIDGLALADLAGYAGARLSGLSGRMNAELDVDATVASDGRLQLNSAGTLSVADVSVAQAGGNLGARRLAWQGAVDLVGMAERSEWQTTADGVLAVDGAAVELPEVKLLRDSIAWTGQIKANLAEAGGMHIDATGQLTGGPMEFALAAQDLTLTQKSLTWDGTLTLAAPAGGSGGLQLDGRLASGPATLSLPRHGLSARKGQLVWTGRIQQAMGADDASSTAAGRLELAGVEVNADDAGLHLLQLGGLVLDAVQVEQTDRVTVATLGLNDLTLVQRSETGTGASGETVPLLRARRVDAEQLRLVPGERLSLDRVELQDMDAHLQRRPDGRLDLIDELRALQKGTPKGTEQQPAAPAGEAESAMGIRLGRAEITGTSTLHFADEAVTPAFRTTLAVVEGHVADLDSAKPEQPSPFVLVGQRGKYAKVALRGTVTPFAERLSLDLKGDVQGFELHPLSPYAEPILGYGLTSGDMNADVVVKVVQDALEGELQFEFHQLQVKAREAGPEAAAPKLAMPLDTALNMLRDKDDSIRLKVPVSGDMNNPQFSFQDAINKAIGKAASAAAVSYLKFALQPYGAIISAAQLAGEAAARVRLDPVPFPAGAAALDTAATAYLDKMAEVMEQRAGIRIRLCGHASEGDRTALQARSQVAVGKSSEQQAQPPAPAPVANEALLKLAGERAGGVKDYLVRRHGIDPGRLILCAPALDSATDATPRVEPLI